MIQLHAFPLHAVAADLCGCDSRRLPGDRPKKGVHGGNTVSPVLNEVIPLETLRRGLRADTFKELLLGDRAVTS